MIIIPFIQNRPQTKISAHVFKMLLKDTPDTTYCQNNNNNNNLESMALHVLEPPLIAITMCCKMDLLAMDIDHAMPPLDLF